MNLFSKTVAACVIAFTGAAGVHAGPYTNDLAKCLVESTSVQDRRDLVKWMFAAASLHPAVQSIANVTEEQLDMENRKTAHLFMKLVTESCRDQTQKALRFEGAVTLQTSFQVLGQVAGQELFTSPEVNAAMAGLERHLDKDRLNALMPAQ